MGDTESKPQSQPQNPQQTAAQQPQFDEEPAFKLQPGRPNIAYYWIDKRIYSAENQMCYNHYRKHFRMDIFTSIQGLRSALKEWKEGDMVKVLAAAGLPDEDFKELHNEPRVAEVFLYCANEERAKLLMLNFSKIAGYGLRKEVVVQLMRKAQERPPKKVVPITEQLIGKPAEGISIVEKPLMPTSVGSSSSQPGITSGMSGVNVNNSFVTMNLDPNSNVNQSAVNVNMNFPVNVNQSTVNVQLSPPVNVNQSSVVVNLNPPVNVNQSSVMVNMNPAPINVNNSSVVVNLQPPKPVNINNSSINIPI